MCQIKINTKYKKNINNRLPKNSKTNFLRQHTIEIYSVFRVWSRPSNIFSEEPESYLFH